MEVLDEIPDTTGEDVVYGTFGPRFRAAFVDVLILSPLTVVPAIFHLNFGYGSLIISFIMLAYRPFCEAMYGATLGKMAFKLRVVSYSYEAPGISEVLGRNIFHMLPGLASVLFTVDSYLELTGMSYVNQYELLRYVNMGFGVLVIADVIALLMDDQRRTIHDRIGKTYVIVKSTSM